MLRGCNDPTARHTSTDFISPFPVFMVLWWFGDNGTLWIVGGQFTMVVVEHVYND